MGIRERLSGNEAVSYAIKQINPDVMPAFPITPSTEIPQFISTYISNGEIDTEFIPVESEHSAMSAAIGASAAGCLNSNLILRYGADVGGALCCSFQPSADRTGSCKQSFIRPDQYQLRPLRQYGCKRYRMAPDLCRE